MDIKSIKQILSKNKEHYHTTYGVSELAVFGSYARNEQTEESDVDIIVDFDKPIGLAFITLATEIEEVLGKKVDLVTKRMMEQKPRLYNYVKQDIQYV